jgi:hypothetical protein
MLLADRVYPTGPTILFLLEAHSDLSLRLKRQKIFTVYGSKMRYGIPAISEKY